MSWNKGQAWATDFILMVILLIFIIFLFITTWDQNALRWNNRIAYEDMWLATSRATDALVATQGLPLSWENLPSGDEQDIQALGLVNSRNIISVRKVERFTSLNYTLVKQRLGLERYDILFTIFDLENNATVASFGSNASENISRVIISRFVMYNGSLATMDLEVYQ